MAVRGAHDGTGRRGGRALLLGPARLGKLRRALALLTSAAVLAGCDGAAAPPATAPASGGTDAARVVSVTDGDTIRLSGLGRVRLIGIDTPEVYGHAECYGAAASAFTKRLLPPGRPVRYRLGVEQRDRYGRALAYVWLDDGTFVNRLLAARGYATPLTIPRNDDYARTFIKAARAARQKGVGLWASARCARSNATALASHGCARFASQKEAQAWADSHRGGSAGMDGDGDGRVCESLPSGR